MVKLKDDALRFGRPTQIYVSVQRQTGEDQSGDFTSSMMHKGSSFEIFGIPAGTYRLTASSAGSFPLGRSVIEVGDQDLTVISLQAMPLQSLTEKSRSTVAVKSTFPASPYLARMTEETSKEMGDLNRTTVSRCSIFPPISTRFISGACRKECT
jgi:hypothetical protein